MKINCLLATAAVALFTFNLSGCANQQNATSTTASNANAGERTYSSDDLNRTGKRTSAEQLQAADPSVTATTGR